MRQIILTLSSILLSFSLFAIAPITGTHVICIGITLPLSDATTGGTWSSSNTAIATVGSGTGMVTGISAGTATITYTVGASYVTYTETITPLPAPITGIPTVCVGSTTLLSDVTSGGIWISMAPASASVGTGVGLVSGIAGYDTTSIYYTLPGACWSRITITVNPMPSAITGTTSVCVGSATTLFDVTSGGTWASSTPAVASVDVTGIVAGIGSGIATISYGSGTCFSTVIVTVNPIPTLITGSSIVCLGATTPLSDATPGGFWITTGPATAIVGSSSGIVTGVALGSTSISYSFPGGCGVGWNITVNAIPSSIVGSSNVCVGNAIPLTDITISGIWSSSNPAVAGIDLTGLVSGVSAGTAIISYSGSGCAATKIITVNPLPTITTSSTHSCGGAYTLTASGGSTYSWSPASGLTCTTCSTSFSNPMATTTYTVTVTDGTTSCSDTASVMVDGNRISGYLSPSGVGSAKVWLIQFNPSDSTLTAQDSMITCTSGGSQYFEFDDKASGSYLVKAFVVGGVPGSSGYIPTYGLSTPHWDSANSIVHSSATDTMHINMIYGTVPSGTGFISGFVVSGAGKGTSTEVPLPNVLVYLIDATTNNILTYTHTDLSGAYSFSGLANGTYIIYPEVYKYYTTPSAVLTLSTFTDTIIYVNFKQHTTLGTITPFLITTGINQGASIWSPSVFPNPAKDELNISGITGVTNYKLESVTGVTLQDGNIEPLNNSIPMHNIIPGIYILELTSKDGDRNIVRVVKE